MTWNSDQCVAWCILRECCLSVGFLSIIGGKYEVVVLLNMLQRHLYDKCELNGIKEEINYFAHLRYDHSARLQMDALMRDPHQDDPMEASRADRMDHWC